MKTHPTKLRAEGGEALVEATALILAGGLGTRLRAAVADRPKVMAPIHGRPFVMYLLDQLAEAGVRHAVLCVGYMGQWMQEHLGSAYGRLRLDYSQEEEPLGTAGALALAAPQCGSAEVVVLNGDSYCEADLAALWAWHARKRAAATILLAQMSDASRFGRVCVDDDGRVRSFAEKDASAGPGWINAGIYVLHRSLLQEIPARCNVSLERQMFPAWVERGLYGCAAGGAFLDIGTPQSYARAEAFFAKHPAVGGV
jgi:D-glycero-alpha-D-manno-heptose 1-phosphate guanylyltransferase